MTRQSTFKPVLISLQCLFALALLLTGCVVPSINKQTIETIFTQPTSPLNHTGRISESISCYVYIDFADMVDTSEAIIIGKVKSISRAQWNQDSGEYCANCFVIHHIEIEVLATLVNTIQLEQEIKVPVISESYRLDEKNNVIEELRRPHDLSKGDQALFFIRRTELAWRGGKKIVYYIAAPPDLFYFKLGADGRYHGGQLNENNGFSTDELAGISLETLKARIEEERATPCDVNRTGYCPPFVNE